MVRFLESRTSFVNSCGRASLRGVEDGETDSDKVVYFADELQGSGANTLRFNSSNRTYCLQADL